MAGKKLYLLNLLLLSCMLLSVTGCGKNTLQDQPVLDDKLISEAEKKYQSPDWKIRQEAIQDIIGYSTYGAIATSDSKTEALLLSATEDVHGAVKVEALKGLAQYRSEKVLDRLIHMSATERDANVRWFALLSLGQHGSPRSVPVFLQNLKSDDWLIREASIKGILLLHEEKLQRDMESHIIAALDDPSTSVKITTMKHLDIKTPGIYQALSRTINSPTRPSYSLMKATLEAIMGYTLDTKTRGKIIELLTHQNAAIRILALRVLKEEKNTRRPEGKNNSETINREKIKE